MTCLLVLVFPVMQKVMMVMRSSDGGVCVVTRPALIHCCLVFVFLHLWECSDLCFLLNQKIAFHISLFGDTLGTVSSVHAHYGGVLA